MGYREDRGADRASRRARASRRTTSAVDPRDIPDPLLHSAASQRSPLAVMSSSAAASLGAHGAVLIAAVLATVTESSHGPTTDAPIDVQLVEPPAATARPPDLAEAPPLTPPAPPVEPPPAPAPRKAREIQVKAPPPDPIDVPPPPPEPVPQRRVLGIEMESTTTGGDGEGFATGTSRMGQTPTVAGGPGGGGGGGSSLTPPRRTSAPTPEYPAALRARGVEGDVGLEVEVDATGHVARVSVVAPSAHPEFNASAAEAAARGGYEPAKVDGVPVSRAIAFTVRFRLHP